MKTSAACASLLMQMSASTRRRKAEGDVWSRYHCKDTIERSSAPFWCGSLGRYTKRCLPRTIFPNAPKVSVGAFAFTTLRRGILPKRSVFITEPFGISRDLLPILVDNCVGGCTRD